MNLLLLKNITKIYAITINKNSLLNLEAIKFSFNNFLNDTIEYQYITYFTNLFEKYLDEYSSFKSEKKIALNSVKIISICEDITKTLSYNNRIFIVFYLLILIKDTNNTTASYDFLQLITDMFCIDAGFYKNLSNFIINNNKSNAENLIIDNKIIANFIILPDKTAIIFSPQTDDFKQNNNNLLINKYYFFNQNVVISHKNIKKFYFQDIIITKAQNDTLFNLFVENLEIKVKNKTLFHKFSGKFSSGELIGVIGKSGSGKTTFLKTIAGINNYYSGSYNTDKTTLKKSYVEQYNAFIPLFSVIEHLKQRIEFLSLPKTESSKIINKILDELHLSSEKNKIAVKTDQNNAQLSGGQLKRLALAIELISNPDILILDEPTSGLASNDALNIISLLKNIAKQNKIVITSIHQPDYESFLLFDKILIIDDGGFPIFFDAPTLAIDYFRNIFDRIDKNSLLENYFNPAILLSLIDEKLIEENGKYSKIRIKTPQELYNIFYEKQPNSKNIKNKINKKQKTKQNLFKDIFIQLKFSIKIDIKNKIRLILLSLIPLFTGFLLSFLTRFSNTINYDFYYNPNIAIWLLMLLISAVFIGLVGSAHEFIFLRKFHKIENILINKNLALTFSKIIKYLGFSALQSLFLITPSVFIINAEFHLIYLFTIVWMLIFWGNLISLLLSKIFKSVTIIYLLIPLIIIPQMIFSGGLIQFNNFNKFIPKYSEIPFGASVFPIRWASEAVVTKFFIDNKYQNKIFQEKQFLFDAVFYLDYLIPELKNISKYDSIFAEKIFINEFPDYLLKTDNIGEKLNKIENYYIFQKQQYQYLIDKNSNQKDKKKYTNIEISKICTNSLKATKYEIKNNCFERKFMPIYAVSSSFKENSVFLTGIKTIFNNYFFTYDYNLMIIIIYNLILSLILILINKKQTKF